MYFPCASRLGVLCIVEGMPFAGQPKFLKSSPRCRGFSRQRAAEHYHSGRNNEAQRTVELSWLSCGGGQLLRAGLVVNLEELHGWFHGHSGARYRS